MPISAKITITGLYNYDNTIFDGLQVPDADTDQGIPAVDKDTAINQILIDCGDLELIYADLEFMRAAIANFSRVNAQKWKMLQWSAYAKYEPLANVDATETETRDLTYNRDLAYKRDDKGRYAGFNSSAFRDVTQTDATDTEKGDTTDKGTITRRRLGNIGVTSSQSLIRETREIADFSIYKVISDDFKNSFCCMIY